MLGDLIERARTAAPEAFEDEEFRWPPQEIQRFDVPPGEVEIVGRPAGTHIVIVGEVDPRPDTYLDYPLVTRGLDALAWYRSYHFGERGWGIYVTEAGVRRTAQVVGGDADLAFEVLWSHEYFHFVADVAATFIEAESRAASYLPHYRLRQASPPPKGHEGWCEVAEAVANGYALDRLDVRSRVRELREWMRTQPAGYKDGPAYARTKPGGTGVAAAERGRREVMWHLVAPAAGGPGAHPDPSPSVLEVADALSVEADVPFYWVSDRRELRPVSEPFIATATVATTPGFDKRIGRLGLQEEWAAARDQLGENAQHPGLHFKKLRGASDMFSIRLGRGYRCLLRLDRTGTLIAEDADKRSDVYR